MSGLPYSDYNRPHGYRWATEEEWERYFRFYDTDEPLLGATMAQIVYTPDGRIYADRSLLHLAVLDDRNGEILQSRLNMLNEREGARVGDFVIFADGVVRRFSHDWDEHGLQTSDGGSFYLGNGYLSYSGSLHPPILREDLEQVSKIRWGSAWFFHHDCHKAHNGVHVRIPLRVFKTSKTSKER